EREIGAALPAPGEGRARLERAARPRPEGGDGLVEHGSEIDVVGSAAAAADKRLRPAAHFIAGDAHGAVDDAVHATPHVGEDAVGARAGGEDEPADAGA